MLKSSISSKSQRNILQVGLKERVVTNNCRYQPVIPVDRKYSQVRIRMFIRIQEMRHLDSRDHKQRSLSKVESPQLMNIMVILLSKIRHKDYPNLKVSSTTPKLMKKDGKILLLWLITKHKGNLANNMKKVKFKKQTSYSRNMSMISSR